jgi:hypothetical protein
MGQVKLTPRQTLWTMFMLQVAFSLGLLLIAFYVHVRAAQLISGQPAMQMSEQRARAHIQTERDIEQLRGAALHVQNASDITWSAVIEMMRDLDTGMWGICLSSVGIAIVGGCTVFAFRVRKTQPDTTPGPAATVN